MDLDDTLYTTSNNQNPTNANGHDQTLVCETDLVNCCESQMLGHWYLPNGDIVTNSGNKDFRSNRGPNEYRNGQQFNGSVRIFRRYSPPQRGRFLCELPSNVSLSDIQTLYANIGESFFFLGLLMIIMIILFNSEFWARSQSPSSDHLSL